jgi:hypothetical protein
MSTAPTPTGPSDRALHARHHHARDTAGRAGHLVAAGVNLVILYLVNIAPGWDALPFLTADTTLVLGLVNLSLWVTVAAEFSYVLVRSRTWRAAGDAVTTTVGLAAIVRMWQVFPFDVSNGWEITLRLLLGIAVVGSLIGLAAALSRLVSGLTRSARQG